MNLNLLYGPPCSGKTTLAKRMIEERNIDYLSIGELSRGEIKKGSSLGRRLKKYIEDVKEYPPELVMSLIDNHILGLNKKTDDRIVFIDGFPKYNREAIVFKKLLLEHHIMINTIFVIKLGLRDVVKRSGQRRICINCLGQFDLERCPRCDSFLVKRDDDDVKLITRRYFDYKRDLNNVLKILHEVSGGVVFLGGGKNIVHNLKILKSKIN
jgi:adenylate kinase